MILTNKLIFLFGILFINTAYCAVGFLPYVEKPCGFEDQEGCYVPDLQKVIPYGEPYTPIDGKCLRYICNKGETVEQDLTQIASCGVIGVQDGCTLLPADLSLPYPDCCKREPSCP